MLTPRLSNSTFMSLLAISSAEFPSVSLILKSAFQDTRTRTMFSCSHDTAETISYI